MAPTADSPAGAPDPQTGAHVDTIAICSGRPAPVPDAPLNSPIVPASTYRAGGEVGYARYGNPGWAALEEALGDLDGGRALTFATGMAAAYAITALLPTGRAADRPAKLVLGDNCYLGVAAAARDLAERGDVSVIRVPVDDTEAIVHAAADADMVWLESPSNPLMGVADLAAVGASLRELPALLVVDSTFATPVLQRPLALGADLVLHSATKFMSGHSDALLGVVVGADDEVMDRIENHRRHTGATPGVLEAFLVLRGLRTLPLRVRHAQGTAQLLAERLAAHPVIQRVRYPGFGSLLSIDLADAAAADRLVSGTRIWVNATSLGGVESTFERRRRWPEESADVPEGLVRMSVGLEHVDDLWADLTAALG